MMHTPETATPTTYARGCHCDACRAANAQDARRRKAGSDKFARRADLLQFMVKCGWDRTLPNAIPKVFVDRWNREHPERPYIGSGKVSPLSQTDRRTWNNT